MPVTTPTENLASQLRRLRRSSRAERATSDNTGRQLVLAAFAVPAVALVTLSIIVLTVLLMAGSSLTGVGTAVAACWLAIHQVPITISGVTIGVLPLLPTMLVVGATGRQAARAARVRRSATGGLTAVIAAAVAGPLLITAMSLAVVMDGTTVLPVQSPNALLAFGYTLGIHGAAALGGVAWASRRIAGRRWSVSVADRRGIRLGGVVVAGLFAFGGLVIALRLFLNREQVGELIGTGNDFDGYLGLAGLSLLYLPNLMVGVAALFVGSDAHVGMATMDLFTVHGGPIPPVPVLAVLPDVPGAGRSGAVGFVVPILVAVLVAWRSRDLTPIGQARAIGVAAVVAGTGMAVLTWMAGGELGEFGTVGISVSTAGIYTFGWVAGVGLLVALVHGLLPATRRTRAAESDESDWDQPDWDDPDWDDDYVIVTDAELDEYDAEYGDESGDELDDAAGLDDATDAGSEYADTGYDDTGHGDVSGDADGDADGGVDRDVSVADGDSGSTETVRRRIAHPSLSAADLEDDEAYDLYPARPERRR